MLVIKKPKKPIFSNKYYYTRSLKGYLNELCPICQTQGHDMKGAMIGSVWCYKYCDFAMGYDSWKGWVKCKRIDDVKNKKTT